MKKENYKKQKMQTLVELDFFEGAGEESDEEEEEEEDDDDEEEDDDCFLDFGSK